MQKYISKSEIETKGLAAKLAKKYKSNIIALNGQLGAGKTIFVQGFAQELGIKDKIISPTFVLIRQYIIPNTKQTLYHIDLYRLEGINNIKEIGLKEILENPNNVVLIEWAEKIQGLLPENIIKIDIQKTKDDNRIITIS